MEAKKCDRCGKLYEHSEIIEDYNSDPRMRYGIFKDCHPQGEVRFDLCKACRKDFYKWFSKYDS